ncbi:proteasome assembly chaperone family protein [Infirmifilum sp. NZ]|uniref:proteasome assembly chaperone family protein n=1 Tax=Infirmifilum sp. NZ TaxID=2926850 RepID=UPI00279A5EBA|nr:PAC2 family protein [Infirmifilum sp. NZ]UNQ74306.1 PAC2 family protein [Infirmifilum sp. NZ]
MRITTRGRVQIVLNREFKASRLITGFHGIGHVGWIAVKHLVEKAGAVRVGHVISPYMQPFVSVKNGIRTPYELYVAGETLYFLPNVPLSDKDVSLVTRTLSEEVIENGVTEAVLFGGLDNRFKQDDSIRLAPTTAFYEARKELFLGQKYRLMEEGLGVVGPLAIILSIFESRELPAVAILPYAAPDRPDPRAAAEALRAYSELFNSAVSVEELIREGELVERELEELENKIKQMAKEREPPHYYV